MPCRLQIKVIPNSSRDQIVGYLGKQLKIKVRAQPEKGKANSAVISLLAKELGIMESQIIILSGHTNSNKVVELTEVTNGQLFQKLGNYSD